MSQEQKPKSLLAMYKGNVKKKEVRKQFNIPFDEATADMIGELQQHIDFNRFIIDSLMKNGLKKMHSELKKELNAKQITVNIGE